MSGKSTLIIDCDLRKPSLHVHLGLKPSAGLLEFLSEGASSRDVRDIINSDPASEARVILGSHHSDTPTDDLITSEAFSRLLASVKTEFDVVILDTPPIGQVVDGIYLAEFADVVVFVVKWASTPQGGARSAVASLRESAQDDIEILTVINQQKTSRLMQAPGYAEYYYER
jgi:Mrp family chromosome partitioning ATPase